MKHLTIFILLKLFIANSVYAQWEVKHVDDEPGTLRVIKFYDLSHGLSMGDNGKILKTLDGGESWQEIENDLEGDIADFDFISPDTLFAVSTLHEVATFEKKIYQSTDGGFTWIKQFEDQGDFSCIQFVSSQTGFVCGSGSIMKTVDQGATWEVVYDLTSDGFDYGAVREMEMLDDSIGLAVATGRVSGQEAEIRSFVLKTVDGGTSWQQISVAVDFVQLNEIAFLNEEEGFVADGQMTYRTKDGGNTWEALENLLTVADMAVVSESRVVTVNRPESYIPGAMTTFAIDLSEDFGDTWSGEYQNGLHLESVYFHNDSVGYVAGDQSLIMKTDHFGGEIVGAYPWYLFTSVDEIAIPEIECYPNPVKNILYINDIQSEWNYIILNINGVEVLSGSIQGSEIPVAGMPGGTYVLIIEQKGQLKKGVFMKSR